MPIQKVDFAATLVLLAEAQVAHQESSTKRDEARDKRETAQASIATWGVLDALDPFTVHLVEHEGNVYRVTPTDIRLLTTEPTV